MHQTMEDAYTSIQQASTELTGSLASEATTLYNTIHTSDTAMTASLNKAAQVLDEMAQLLQTADIQGAQRMGQR
jgi:hypothetical protein